MHFWFLLIIASIESVSCGDVWGLIHLKKNKEALFACIDNHLDDSWPDRDIASRKAFINEWARVFEWSTLNGKLLDQAWSARNDSLTKDPRGKFYKDIKKALLKCSDTHDYQVIDRNNDEFTPLPYFAHEPQELSRLLNFILVRWPTKIFFEHYLETPLTGVELRRFSEDALNVIESTFGSRCDYNMLREMWNFRALLFFDYRDPQVAYIHHGYSSNFSAPYSIDKQQPFVDRVDTSFEDRMKKLTPDDVNSTLGNIRRPLKSSPADDDKHSFCKDRVHDNYVSCEMTQSDRYFEVQLYNFWKTIFFYLELEDHKLLIDGDHYHFEHLVELPLSKRNILIKNALYRKHLVEKTSEILNGTDEDIIADDQTRSMFLSLKKELQNDPCINERALAMCLWIRTGHRITTRAVAPITKCSLDKLELFTNQFKNKSISQCT